MMCLFCSIAGLVTPYIAASCYNTYDYLLERQLMTDLIQLTGVNRRIPEWLTIKLPKSRDIDEVTQLMRSSIL